MREISSTSLISASKCWPERLMVARLLRPSSLKPLSRCNNCEKPSTALSGVRNSWLMLARKALLALLADSALSNDAASSLVRSLTCLLSSFLSRAKLLRIPSSCAASLPTSSLRYQPSDLLRLPLVIRSEKSTSRRNGNNIRRRTW